MSQSAQVIVFASGEVGLEFIYFLSRNYLSSILCVVLTKDSGPIFELVKSLDISHHVYQNDQDLLEFISRLSKSPMMGFLVWWPKIVSKTIINLFEGRLVNTHPSYLPFNRGKNYNFWALVEQCPFGVTLHFVDEGIDTGPILFQEIIEYNWLDTGESLFYTAKHAMKNLLCKSFPDLIGNDYIPKAQPKNLGSMHFSTELDPASIVELDKPTTARKLFNLLRARTFKDCPSCTFTDSDGRVYNVTISITAQ